MQCAPCDLTVHRNDRPPLTSRINFLHRDVTAFLTQDEKSSFLERLDEFCAGDVRQFAHTATSTLASSGSPIVRSTSSIPQVSMYSSIASLRFAFAISIVSPWEVTGKSRQRATNHLPSNWIAALSFRIAQNMCRRESRQFPCNASNRAALCLGENAQQRAA